MQWANVKQYYSVTLSNEGIVANDEAHWQQNTRGSLQSICSKLWFGGPIGDNRPNHC